MAKHSYELLTLKTLSPVKSPVKSLSKKGRKEKREREENDVAICRKMSSNYDITPRRQRLVRNSLDQKQKIVVKNPSNRRNFLEWGLGKGH